MIVLDTNVISELMKPEPDAGVEGWARSVRRSTLFTTAIAQAEILAGIARLPKGRRRDNLEAAARAVFSEDLAGRILPFDSRAAVRYADLAASRRAAGRGADSFDIQIAAIAQSLGAAVATRNVAHFEGCGLEVIDPWSAGAQP
jgi:toxin FitB